MRGQSWSMDLVIGLLIFTAVILIFFSFIGSNRSDDQNKLEQDARTIQGRLDAEGRTAFPLVQRGAIEPEVLAEIYNTSADDLRARFGTSSHFCIFVETEDGRLLPVELNESGELVTSVGDDGIMVNDEPCGART